ncbi:MAG: proline dehydrogenase family protein [Candidatus Brennerbacteria bacterium]|nr:proline dehydrogenase family protein [Candidatus Brennerbacteria bacterium]
MISILTSLVVYSLGLPRWLMWPFYVIFLFFIFWNFYRIMRNNYIAAKTEEKAFEIFQLLLKRGFYVISDIVGERVKTRNEAWDSKHRYIEHIYFISKNCYKQISISVKPSQCGLYIKYELCREILGAIIAVAHRKNIFVWIDAEKRKDRNNVFHIAAYLKNKRCDNFGVALQANHSDARLFLEKYMKFGIPIRLVKGAYTDGDLRHDSLINEQFVNLMNYFYDPLLQSPIFKNVALGTHDKVLINLGVAWKIAKEFQFLYGVNSVLAEQLLNSGERVAIYVPWGKKSGAYLFRRFREGIRFRTFFLFIRNLWSGYRFRRRLARL